MAISGMRLLFRIIQATLSGVIMLVFVAPGKLCREYAPATGGGGDAVMKPTERCALYEMKAISCPHLHLFNTTDIRDCPLRMNELIMPAFFGFLFLLAYLIDLIFGGKVATWREWSEQRQRKTYFVFVSVSVVCWICVLITMSVVRGVKWPKIVREAKKNADENRLRDLEQSKPPTTWSLAMGCASVILFTNALEALTLFKWTKTYL